MINFEILIQELDIKNANIIENLSSVEEMKEFLYNFNYDYYLKIRNYISDQEKIDQLNIAGDLIVKEVFDKELTLYNNKINLFYIFNVDYTLFNSLFNVLEYRIEENSIMLKNEFYIELLKCFKQYRLLNQYRSRVIDFEQVRSVELQANEECSNNISKIMIKKRKRNLTSKS